MPIYRELVTQGGADTETRVAIATGITAAGREVMAITAIEAMWSDGAAVAAADWSLQAYVNTSDVGFDFELATTVTAVSWGMQNTAGVAVSVPYEPVKRWELLEPRITAQPNIYVGVASAGTGQANDVVIQVHYKLVKLTELEVLRLLAGGA
jgi:hypothetical protein